MAVTCDPEHKFELALQLGDLKTAYQLAKETEVIQYFRLRYWVSASVFAALETPGKWFWHCAALEIGDDELTIVHESQLYVKKMKSSNLL